MSITLGEETFLTLTEAARRLPSKNSGRRTHVAALYRWASIGCRGVVLETIHVGGTRFTSMRALQQFFEELTRRAQNGHGGATRSESRRESDVARAAAEVDRMLSAKP